MADVGKVASYVAFGAPEASADVTKVVMYVLLVPGEGELPPPNQSFIYSQKITR